MHRRRHAGQEIGRGFTVELKRHLEGLGLGVGLGGELLDPGGNLFPSRHSLKTNQDPLRGFPGQLCHFPFGNVNQHLDALCPLELNNRLPSCHRLVGLHQAVRNGSGIGRPELGVGNRETGSVEGLLGRLHLGLTNVDGRLRPIKIRL